MACVIIPNIHNDFLLTYFESILTYFPKKSVQLFGQKLIDFS